MSTPRTRSCWSLAARCLLAIGLATQVLACSSSREVLSDASVDPEAEIEIILGLRRDQAGIVRAATARRTTGDTAFGERLDLTTVAESFGASDEDIALVQQTFSSEVQIDPTRGFARLRATVSEVEDAFGTTFVRRDLDGLQIIQPSGDLRIPAAIIDVVTEVVGLTQVVGRDGPARSDDVSALRGSTACDTAPTSARALAERYGLGALAESGATGAGAKVAVISTQRVDSVAFDVWLDCLGRVDVGLTEVDVTGERATSDDGDEIQVDLAAITIALPGIEEIAVVGADEYDWLGDPIAAALGAPGGVPDVITTSVVYCETALPDTDVELAEYILAAASLVGTTVVAATGDHGSTSCHPQESVAAVTYPASSPFVLAVGGSNAADEVWSEPAMSQAGGGGGSSRFDDRVIPDVVALASPDDLPPVPVCAQTCAWESLGGTSFSAPLVAAGIVLVSEARAHAGFTPIVMPAGGLGRPGSPVPPSWTVDVTEGTNDLDGVGCCTAGPGFDPASGLGTPRFDQIALAP